MPCPFTGPKMLCEGPNFLCQIKISFTYCGSHKYFVADKKKGFAISKIVFCASTKVFEEALNAVKFLGWLKIFGPAQNILGPVKGQGIRMLELAHNPIRLVNKKLLKLNSEFVVTLFI